MMGVTLIMSVLEMTYPIEALEFYHGRETDLSHLS